MHSKEKSYRTIFITLVCDLFLFAFALAVSMLGHSKAVLSESVYQLSDVLSGTMLLFGIWSSLRPADELHPFGYGLERFFWSFVSAVFAFSVSGAAVMVYGINGILQPYVLTDWQYSVLVLAVTAIVSAVSLAYLLHRIRLHHGRGTGMVDRYHQGVRTVLLQDVMSIVSSMVAVGGISLSVYAGNSRFDAMAAVANGVLLIVTGLTLAAEGRELLIGKGLSRAQMSKITQAVTRLPSVHLVREVKTVYIGPESLLMLIKINFADGLTTDELEQAIDRVQVELRSRVPELKNVIVEPES